MLRGLIVEGVKSFTGRHDIPLAPLTLVFGRNSAGKSTLLQSLLLLKQSVELGDPDDPMLISRGPHVDAVSFTNIVSMHDRSRSVRLGLHGSITRASPLSAGVELEYAEIDGLPRLRSLTVLWSDSPRSSLHRWTLNVLRDKHDEHGDLHYNGSGGEEALTTWLSTVLGPRRGAGQWNVARNAALGDAEDGLAPEDIARAVSALDLRFVRPVAQGRPVGTVPTRFAREERDGSDADIRAAIVWLLEHAETVLHRELDSIASIGPLRDPLPRVALAGNPRSRTTGRRGERVLEILAGNADLLEQVNEYADELELGYRVLVERVSAAPADDGGMSDEVLGDIVALRFLDDYGVRSGAADVGFGITQILPVIVQAVAFPGDTVLVEQPELHLHPKLQGRMADLFCREAPKTRFILETHSEHLVLRTMTNVVREVIQPTEAQVLYVDRSREPTRHHRIRFDPDGELIGGWPDGFFMERADELLLHDQALAERNPEAETGAA